MSKKADKYLKNAEASLLKKNYTKAIKYYRSYLELCPEDKKTIYKMADAYAYAGDNKSAIKLYLGVADYYNKKHFLMKAIAVCKRVLNLDPENQRAKALLNELYKDKDEELETTQQFLRSKINQKIQEYGKTETPVEQKSEAPLPAVFQPESPGSQQTQQPQNQQPGQPTISQQPSIASPQPSAQQFSGSTVNPQPANEPFQQQEQSQSPPSQIPQQPQPQPTVEHTHPESMQPQISPDESFTAQSVPPQQDNAFEINQPQTQPPCGNQEFEGVTLVETNEPPAAIEEQTIAGLSTIEVMRDIQEVMGQTEALNAPPAPPRQDPQAEVSTGVVAYKNSQPVEVSPNPIDLVEPDDMDVAYDSEPIEVLTGEFFKPTLPVQPPTQEEAQTGRPQTYYSGMDSADGVQQSNVQPVPEKLGASDLLFDELDRNEYLKIVDLMEIRLYEPGTPIVREGDPGDSMFIICTGEVSVHTFDKFGNSILLARLGEGDFFGEVSLLTGKPRTATIVSETPTELLELNASNLPEIELYSPNITAKLEAFYKKRMRQTVEKLIQSQY